MVRPTFLDDEPHGVFASRHPCRPNSLGLTIVKLLGRSENFLEVSGIDVLDGTPLIRDQTAHTSIPLFPGG